MSSARAQVCGLENRASRSLELLWPKYVDGACGPPSSAILRLISDLATLLTQSDGLLKSLTPTTSGYRCFIDFQALLESPMRATIERDLERDPLELLRCLEIAAHDVLLYRRDSIAVTMQNIVRVSLVNYNRGQALISDLKANLLGKFVFVKGTIVSAGRICSMVRRMCFTCSKCKLTSLQSFANNKFLFPKSCPTEGCRSHSFYPEKSTCDMVDVQRIRIQEDALSSNNLPRYLDCELREDMVGVCTVGSQVGVLGLLKATDGDEDLAKKKTRGKPLFQAYIDVISVCDIGQKSPAHKETGSSSEESKIHFGLSKEPKFLPRELEFVSYFVNTHRHHAFQYLANSICPGIYGHQSVKSAICLALFGGVRKFSNSTSRVPIRGDIHVLLLGDPGLGKSQLLKAAARVSPRGVYVCGNTSTGVGLTASVRSSGGGDHSFEAGAMVLANGGLCCIDEFDKMKDEHNSLLEAMEQQSVSLAKAGLLANLATRTTVLAAANPRGGHYDLSRTLEHNLNLNSAVLSRFDVVLPMLDMADSKRDEQISRHVMSSHSTIASRTSILSVGRDFNSRSQKTYNTENLPESLFKTYILYAKRYCNPKVSQEARATLKEYYQTIRREDRGQNYVTPRRLESLVRMVEARARVDLRQEATLSDALEVVELLKQCSSNSSKILVDLRSKRVCIDHKNRKSEMNRYIQALRVFSQRTGEYILTISDLYTVADEIEAILNIEEAIQILNENGILIKKGQDRYKVTK